MNRKHWKGRINTILLHKWHNVLLDIDIYQNGKFYGPSYGPEFDLLRAFNFFFVTAISTKAQMLATILVNN